MAQASKLLGQRSVSTALFAVRTRSLKAVRLISKADLSVADEHGTTPLIEAAKISETILDELLTNGREISVNAANESKETALLAACRSGRSPKILKKIVDAGANVNYVGMDGKTALCHLISRRDLESIKVLIAEGGLVNIADESGDWIIHMAVRTENIRIVKAVLSAGADPNKPNAKMIYPLHIAVQLTKAQVDRSLRIERALIESGADINCRDAQGRTPLFIAFENSGSIPRMQVASKELELWTAYNSDESAIAAIKSRLESDLEKYFEKKTVADDLKAEAVEWVREIRARKAFKDVKELVDRRSKDAKYTLGDWKNVTRNDGTEKYDPVEIVDFLLAFPNIEVNISDSFGRTPLHYGARRAASSCVNALVRKGVDINKTDDDGNTAIQIALMEANVDIFLNLAVMGAKITGTITFPDKAVTNFHHALQNSFMSVAYVIKNQGGISFPQIFRDTLKNGKYSISLAAVSAASREDIMSLGSKSQNTLHILADFKPINEGDWETDYVEDIWNRVIGAGVSINEADENGQTPLILASIKSQNSLMQLMLNLDHLNLDAIDNSGSTALHYAISNRSEANVKKLLRRGAKVDLPGTEKTKSLVRLAVDTGELRILEAILDASASPNLEDGTSEITALMRAVNAGSVNAVRALIARKANVDTLSIIVVNKDDPQTPVAPIMRATELNNSAVFEHIIKANADVNFIHPVSGRSSLMIALDRSEKKCASMLLTQGADPNLVDPKFNRTSFQRALLGDEGTSLRTDFSTGMLSAFTTVKVDANIPDAITGFTLVDLAVNAGDAVLLRRLLRLEANPSVISLPTANPLQKSSLLRAIEQNRMEIVKILVETGKADVAAVDSASMGAIHYVVRPEIVASYRNVELLRYLAGKGAPVNAVDASGKRPIDYAVQWKDASLTAELRALGSVEPQEFEADDVEMDDNVVPLGDLEQDAEDERIRLEAEAEAEEREKQEKEAKRRGISVQQLQREERKKKEVKPNPKAGVDNAQVSVLYEGDEDDPDRYPYDCTLHKCDVSYGVYGENKVYKMQVLYNRLQKLYFMFNLWGALGSDWSAMYQKTPFNSKEECVAEFKKVFKSKTGNEWDPRGEFVDQPGKYVLPKTVKKRRVNIKKLNLDSNVKSKLDTGVKEVMQMFTSAAVSKRSLAVSCLGEDVSLDPKVLQEAYEILLEIRSKIKEMNALTADRTTTPSVKVLLKLREELVVLSNDYFKRIPATEAGDSGLSPIMTLDTLNTQMIKVDNLKYLDSGNTLLLGAAHAKVKGIANPYDYLLASIECSINTVSKEAPEVSLIKRLIDTTNGGDNVELIHVLKVDRNDERDAGAMHLRNEIGNRKLLWHGSKMCNFLGILKSGLRVAPIEAEVSGYMFGKGIYFADAFCKSYGYTYDYTRDRNDGQDAYACLLLCEVAVGENPYESETSEYMEAPKDGSHATLGLGSQVPPAGNTLEFADGVKMTLGPLQKAVLRKDALGRDKQRVLSYNEYIVYDPKQVRIRYLVVVRNNTRCHLCSNARSLKPCRDYGKNYEKALVGANDFQKMVLQTLLERLEKTGQSIWDEYLEEKVIRGQIYKKHFNPPTRLLPESRICENCASVIMEDLMETFYHDNVAHVPEWIVNLTKCWYGRECRTQSRLEHARKFNHFCDNTKKDGAEREEPTIEVGDAHSEGADSDEDDEEEDSE
ncbi:poly polymerase catalytic domain-containing protein [Zopfochytrium polystomum]|nr:poly polymerase catalytic domain-containing protein [Zopfochytrium polystomum]